MNCVHVCVCACVRVCVCTWHIHIHPQSTPHHPHLHGMLQVSGGCAEAVEGVVLPNCVDLLTLTHSVVFRLHICEGREKALNFTVLGNT